MLMVLLHLSFISVWIIIFDGAKIISAQKGLYHHSECNLTASNFLTAAWLKLHGFQPVSFLHSIQGYIS